MVQIVATSNNQTLGRGKKRHPRGVTLLEILVAVGVMAFAISAIMQIFPVGFADSTRASYLAVAYELAGQKMEEIRGMYLFGGDPDVDIKSSASATNSYKDTYKFFGHRTHPATAVNSAFTETTMLGNGNDTAFVAFDSRDGASVEARYFYSVDIVPMVDVTQRSANVPRAYSKLEREAAKADWEDHDKRYNFPDCYRVTVKVRGPLSSADQAAEENWEHYSKGAVEATLATIISNKEFGIGYLAYDVVSRFKSRSITNSSGEYAEVMWHSQINSSTGAVPDRATSAKAALDSRSIFVSGVGNGTDNKRFYPESFTMLDPSRLTLNEMFDTGPAIVDGSGTYYMLRHQANPWDGCRYPSGREYNAGKVNWNTDGTPGNPARCWVPQNTAGWDDVSWSSANDYVWSSTTTNTRYNNHGNVTGKYRNADAVVANDYIPGGLNLLGQDNILIVCVKGSKVYAESNKLLFMVPPHTTDVVGVYGKDYITDNNTDYWRFDLLNQVYGRDSDCSNRPVVYGSANLADGTYDGDYSLGTSPDTFNGTLNLSGIASAVYGYPKATFSSSGAFQDGTVVRFMMTMPKQ